MIDTFLSTEGVFSVVLVADDLGPRVNNLGNVKVRAEITTSGVSLGGVVVVVVVVVMVVVDPTFLGLLVTSFSTALPTDTLIPKRMDEYPDPSVDFRL